MTSQEMERNIEEIWSMIRATNQQMKETDQYLKRLGEETDRRIKETNEQMRATDQRLRRMSKDVGDLGNSWGDFVEGLVIPAVRKGLFKKYGIPVNRISERRREYKGDEEMEMDVIAVNGDQVVVIEVKSRVNRRHINKHIKKLTRFKEFFTDHKDKIILGGIAGATFDSGTDNYAIRNGLFVIKQRGDHVEFANKKEFQPKEW